MPDDDPSVNSGRAELCDRAPRRLIRADHCYGVLVDRGEFRVILHLSLQIHLFEHIQSRLFPIIAHSWPALGFQGPSQLPARLATLEAEGLTVVTSSDDFGLAGPEQALERKQLSCDAEDCLGGLVRSTGVDNSDAAVVSSEGQGVAARRERHRVDPASGVVEELSADSVERQPLTPSTGFGALVN